MKSLDDVTNFIIYALKVILGNDFADVPKVQLYCHYIESVLITLINMNKIGELRNGDKWHILALGYMSELGLLANDIVSFFGKYREVIETFFRYETLSEWGEPHSIHEGLLGRELNISKTDIWFSVDKFSRDTTGSYYTPPSLATAVICETIEKYLKINCVDSDLQASRILSNVTIADFSCGCGEFIKGVQNYLEEKYGIDSKQICKNFYGIDIDPIALQVTVCDLLKKTDKTQWREIISHFTLGNPLIDQINEKSFDIKTSLFATKRYYANDFGIDMRGLFQNACIDIIVGNPPWEKIRFEERKFFKTFYPSISEIPQKNIRQSAIENYKELNSNCYEWYTQISNDYSMFRHSLLKHPYIRKSRSGELNTYALFTELSLNIMDECGVSGQIVKSAIVTSPANKTLFQHMVANKNIASICLYENALRIFNIDSRERFCVIILTKTQNKTIEIIAGAREITDIHSLKRNLLEKDDIKAINPYTLMLPNVSRNEDLEVLKKAHDRLPVFDTVYSKCRFGRLVHLTAHASHISTQSTDNNLPIYEGKFIERYDARFATFAGMPRTQKYAKKASAKRNPQMGEKKELPESRYYICKAFWDKLRTNYPEPYMLCWRSLTSTTNARTTLAMLLPTMPTCQSIQFLQTNHEKDMFILLALLNSKPFDYFVRLKMPGIDLTQSVIKQIPVPPYESYQMHIQYSGFHQSLEQHILNRVSTILAKEPMTESLKIGNKHPFDSMCIIDLEKELDELYYLAYGFSDSEKKAIEMSFKK